MTEPPEHMTELTRAASVRKLAPGKTYSEAVRLDSDTSGTVVPATLEELRSRFRAVCARAKRATQAVYTIETGYFMTRDFAIICVVAVTRTDNAEEKEIAVNAFV